MVLHVFHLLRLCLQAIKYLKLIFPLLTGKSKWVYPQHSTFCHCSLQIICLVLARSEVILGCRVPKGKKRKKDNRLQWGRMTSLEVILPVTHCSDKYDRASFSWPAFVSHSIFIRCRCPQCWNTWLRVFCGSSCSVIFAAYLLVSQECLWKLLSDSK